MESIAAENNTGTSYTVPCTVRERESNQLVRCSWEELLRADTILPSEGQEIMSWTEAGCGAVQLRHALSTSWNARCHSSLGGKGKKECS